MKHVTLLVLSLFSVAAMAGGTETFRMYTQPNAKPNPNCDVHTRLQVDYGKDGITATLVNAISGACELFIEPNPRTYIAPLQMAKDNCGSVTYAYLARGTGQPIFQLVDHRNRTCENFLPALIEVTEVDAKGTVHFFSKDN